MAIHADLEDSVGQDEALRIVEDYNDKWEARQREVCVCGHERHDHRERGGCYDCRCRKFQSRA